MPAEFPAGAYDLVTICAMGFYLCGADLLQLRDLTVQNTVPGAHVVLVHWTPPVRGHASTAHEVHDVFVNSTELRHIHRNCAETYRLDVMERR
jgi:hypothetical protein